MNPVVWLVVGLLAAGIVGAIAWSASRRSEAQLSAVRQEMQSSLASQGQSVTAQINNLVQAMTQQLGQVRSCIHRPASH
jgi:ribosomal protein S3AE